MKKILSILLALTMLISALAFSATAYAVEYVSVYLNDKAVDFPSTDARPQIINNRTYVPVRKTCEALGLEIDWNSKTETMTLTRDGVTIAHTMRSKIVYVNGEAVTFDTASINANNRILMPIRMIAESVGATVTWDDPTRSVHITTKSDSNNVSNAVVNSISASNTAVAKDTEIIITAVCSKETTSVKFVRTTDNSNIGSVSKYTENDDGTRSFVTEYKCENSADSDSIVTIQAVPGIGNSYNETMSAAKSVSVMISGEKTETTTEDASDSDSSDYKSDNMISCKLTSDEIKTDDYAKFKVKTTSKVKKVKLTTNANSQSAVISSYDEDDDGDRTFNGKLQMTKEGNWKVYVTLYVSGDYEEDSETFSVNVDDNNKSSSSSDDLEIIEMWTNNDYGYKGYDTTLYVKTSTDVDYLEILTEDQDEGEGVRTHSTAEKKKNYYYWEFSFTVKHTGDMKFRLLAFNEDGESVSDTFRLEGRSVSKSEPAVLEIEQKTNSLIEGEEAQFNITTTGCVNRIRITRGTSSSVYDEKVSSTSSTDKTHKVTFEVDDIDADYYVTAYDDDDYDRMKFKLSGDVEEEIEIRDVDIEDDTVDEDEDIKITVTTSNSAVKVWVEDARGENKLSKVYKTPDDEDGNDLIWEIEFSPIEDGRKKFVVIAQDDNKKEDSYTFGPITIK
ncbi:MAG: copper amine oxidase N-terminal domain-containing protein [Clostridia bacterium]|nr:copper amine oxidase N-terminal domain-containing protein [Clostridia bacterium]